MENICGLCSFNDGMVYTSLPPKVKCMLTGKFHSTSDLCEIDFSKIDDENGNWHVNKPLPNNEDIVEVVRCKDCIHHTYWCSYLETRTNPDDYCSWGERKEDAERNNS